ncbi:LysM peptidoglycan-binding domain-containing protein [Clostridium brassicae]|uniref:LysM peptidoglycan-binding domain-containing protein n=1 Tax=Clostridium brassicae TaxID=2999072 RepID=A0ABT4D5D6_9CLOT|nr:LysM peptidoglycan-binding domain-containing protein [Clostridium brassicae]MCY6957497.1 LysM peptidoglycan-binding domain-containing protein [Clostridium brassicae]
MNYKLKKPLIIIFSGIILFVGVFFMTRSISNLVDTANNSTATSIDDTNSQTDNNKDLQNTSQSTDENSTKLTNNEQEGSNEDSDTLDNKSKTSKTEGTHVEYVVKSGDALSTIAEKFMPWSSKKQAIKTLIEINKLKNPEILPVGSHLLIPENPIDTSSCIEHKVTKGETLYKIAIKYFPGIDTNKSIKMIMEKNNISDAKLVSENMVIYIPKNDISTSNNSNNN